MIKRIIVTGIVVVLFVAAIIVGMSEYLNGSPTALKHVLEGTKDGVGHEAVTDTKDILKLIDEDKFTSNILNSMYFTEEEFKRVIKKVDDSKKLIRNQITYEYYFEEWTVVDHDEDGGEVWGWNKGFRKKTIEITNEHPEKEHIVDWQPIYCLAMMASVYEQMEWQKGQILIQDRVDDKVLDNAIRTFNYEYNYVWDGARSEKKFFKWAELESICYRYSETGDWDVEEYPPGEYHIRTQEKTPTTCISSICNALELFEYEFRKNTQCTPRYQYPDNWEVEYMIYNRDADIFTRACQLTAPNFRWNWFLSLLEELPGVEDTVDEETGEIIPGIYSTYVGYRNEFNEHKSFTKEDYEIPDKLIIVGEELTSYIDNRYTVLKKKP